MSSTFTEDGVDSEIFVDLLDIPSLHSFGLINTYYSSSLAGNYGHMMISLCRCFKALLFFLKIVNYTAENAEDRLCKVR